VIRETYSAMISRMIRAGMNARSWRVEHLSVHSGIPKSTLDAILAGRRKLSDEQRLRLNAAFGWADGWHYVDETIIDAFDHMVREEPTNDKEMTDEADQSQAAQ